MTEPAEALAKLISRYATDEAVSRQVRRLPLFAVSHDGNERLMSLLEKLDETQASAIPAHHSDGKAEVRAPIGLIKSP